MNGFGNRSRSFKLFFATAPILFVFTTSVRATEPITIEGLLKPHDYAELSVREAGTIAEFRVAEGDRVGTDDLLAKIDDSEASRLLARALAELKIAQREAANRLAVTAAENSLRVANEELRRAREVSQKVPNAVSQTEIDQLSHTAEQAALALEKAKYGVALAQLSLELKQADYDIADERLARRELRAPFPGVISRIDLRAGEWAELGRKAVRLVRIDLLRVEASVESVIAEKLVRDRPVSFRAEGSEVQLNGKLTFVGPEVDPFTRNVRISAVLENREEKLKPGLKGTLTILEPTPETAAP